MHTFKKYPYLTTWIGFVVIVQAVSLAYGFGVQLLHLPTDGMTRLVGIALYVIGGFYLFKALVQRYILTNLTQRDESLQRAGTNHSRRYPFLTAWIGFILLSVMIYILLAWFFFSLIRLSDFTAIVFANSVAYVAIGFFVFRKAIQSYIVRDDSAKSKPDSRAESGA